eukprot:2223034-Rhodomonas_salina.1
MSANRGPVGVEPSSLPAHRAWGLVFVQEAISAGSRDGRRGLGSPDGVGWSEVGRSRTGLSPTGKARQSFRPS